MVNLKLSLRERRQRNGETTLIADPAEAITASAEDLSTSVGESPAAGARSQESESRSTEGDIITFQQTDKSTSLSNDTMTKGKTSSRQLASTATATAKSTDSPFLQKLPSDLHYYLIEQHLEWSSILALRLTHPYFASLLSPRVLTRLRTEIITNFLEAEARRLAYYTRVHRIDRLLYNRHYHSRYMSPLAKAATELRCYGCLQLKPLTAFSERMCVGGMSVGAKRAAGRLCKRCSTDRGRVRWGSWERENSVDRANVVRFDSSGTTNGSNSRTKRWGWVSSSRSTNGEDDCENEDDAVNSAATSRSAHDQQEDAAEVGICAKCRRTGFELWWGCPRCFSKEEHRRQQEDRGGLNKLGMVILSGMEKWSEAKVDWHIFRLSPLDRGRGVTRARLRDLRFTGLGTWMKQNREDLRRWKERKAARKVGQARGRSHPDSPREVHIAPYVQGQSRQHRPNQYHPREIRCSACWVPNCPRRQYSLGLAYEFALKQERWCECCQQEQAEMIYARTARKVREYGARDSFDGLGSLFG